MAPIKTISFSNSRQINSVTSSKNVSIFSLITDNLSGLVRLVGFVGGGVTEHTLGHPMLQVFIERNARPLGIRLRFSSECEVHHGQGGKAMVFQEKKYVIRMASAGHSLGRDAIERMIESQFHPQFMIIGFAATLRHRYPGINPRKFFEVFHLHEPSLAVCRKISRGKICYYFLSRRHT